MTVDAHSPSPRDDFRERCEKIAMQVQAAKAMHEQRGVMRLRSCDLYEEAPSQQVPGQREVKGWCDLYGIPMEGSPMIAEEKFVSSSSHQKVLDKKKEEGEPGLSVAAQADDQGFWHALSKFFSAVFDRVFVAYFFAMPVVTVLLTFNSFGTTAAAATALGIYLAMFCEWNEPLPFIKYKVSEWFFVVGFVLVGLYSLAILLHAFNNLDIMLTLATETLGILAIIVLNIVITLWHLAFFATLFYFHCVN